MAPANNQQKIGSQQMGNVRHKNVEQWEAQKTKNKSYSYEMEAIVLFTNIVDEFYFLYPGGDRNENEKHATR